MKNISIVILLSAMLALTACGKDSGSVRVATDYLAAKLAYSKPGARISLKNSQVNLEVAGVEYAIDIHLLSGYSGATLSLDVSASEGLFIVTGDTSPSVTLHRGGVNFPYSVTASKPGRHYIYMNAKVESEGRMSGRALTFVVQVGEEETKDVVTKGAAKVSGNEEVGVFSMPAKEDVSR